MTFAIHASKNGQSVVTIRISPAVAVDKARVLESLGWQVHVTDSARHQFYPSDFDRLSRCNLLLTTRGPPRPALLRYVGLRDAGLGSVREVILGCEKGSHLDAI